MPCVLGVGERMVRRGGGILKDMVVSELAL